MESQDEQESSKWKQQSDFICRAGDGVRCHLGACSATALGCPWHRWHWGMRLEMSPPFNHQLGFGDGAGMDGTVTAP